MQRRHLGIGLVSQPLGCTRLGDIHIGVVGHLRQIARGQGQPIEFALLEQHSQVLQPLLHC